MTLFDLGFLFFVAASLVLVTVVTQWWDSDE